MYNKVYYSMQSLGFRELQGRGRKVASCLKCGVEIPEGKSFCEACLAVMAQHPVPHGTPVVIPKRPSRNAKTNKRKRQTQADTIRKLYRRLRFVTGLCILFGILTVTLAVLLFLTLY